MTSMVSRLEDGLAPWYGIWQRPFPTPANLIQLQVLGGMVKGKGIFPLPLAQKVYRLPPSTEAHQATFHQQSEIIIIQSILKLKKHELEC